jgi:hypothetical protein
MPDFELTPEGHSLVQPLQPLRWIREANGQYRLHKYEIVPPTDHATMALQSAVNRKAGESGDKMLGTWKETPTDILHPDPKSEVTQFRHVPTEDNYTYNDDKAPRLHAGGVAFQKHLDHWTPIHDKMASSAVRGALANENYKTKNFLIRYNKLLKGE